MREVSRTSHVDATPEAIWPDLVEGQRFAEWYAFCDEVEEPAPGTRVLLGSWGSQRSAVTTEIVTAEQPTRFAWRHVAEELDGRPAPAVAIDTTVEVVLEPAADGGTDVTITSRQRPRGAVQAIALKLLARRQLGGMLDQSLDMLAARHDGRATARGDDEGQ
ncbi:MAG: SRPBCC family protein [Actinomycetota bacterium]